jgi:hypothetical protein
MTRTRSINTTVTIPAVHAEHIAHLLERCAEHEDERARGRVTFPRVVMLELATQARHWAHYLSSVTTASDSPPTDS